MAAETATYTGADNILDAFDSVCDGNAFYSIWKGREIITQNNTNDMGKAKQRLESLLAALNQSDNTDLFTIKFHPKLDKNGFITDRSPVISSMKVRVCALSGMGGIGSPVEQGGLNNAAWYMLKEIKSSLDSTATKNIEILERLELLESGGIGEIKEPDLFDKIGSIIEKPGVMDVVKQLLPALTGLLTNGLQPQPNIMVNGMNDINMFPDAGTRPGGRQDTTPVATESMPVEQLTDEQYDVMDVVFKRLSVHTDDVCRDLLRLCDFADNNPQMFQGLLSNLKS